MTCVKGFKKGMKIATHHHFNFGTQIMWTTSGLLGLVLMLLASAETKSRKLQSLTSDTAVRIEYNNMEKLQDQEVNTGSTHNSDSHIHYSNFKSHHIRKLLLQRIFINIITNKVDFF